MSSIHFVVSPVFELLAAMFRIHAHESMLSDRTREVAGQPVELNQWVEQKRAALPADLKKELDVFFHPESFFGLTMIRFAWEKNVYTEVPEFLEKVAMTPSKELFAHFLKTGYAPNDKLDPVSLDAITTYIEKSNLPESEKWKATYLYLHSEETRARFVRLASNFYRFIQDELVKMQVQQEESVQEVRRFIREHGESALNQVLSWPLQPSDNENKLVLAPSVTYYDCSHVSQIEESVFFLYGTKQLQLKTAFSTNKEKVIQAFKILADETRIHIIRLLNQGPLYGYELAQRLQLSNSTVSHHLSTLSSAGLVTAKRKENRVYYEVRSAEIEKLLKQTKEMLLQQ